MIGVPNADADVGVLEGRAGVDLAAVVHAIGADGVDNHADFLDLIAEGFAVERIDWDFGWFGRYVIQSPLHHQLHHSKRGRIPCNLSICPIWDRLGGTWRDVTSSSIELGTSTPYRHGAFVVPDLLRDYRDFLNSRNQIYRERRMKESPPSRAEALRLMSENPNLIKRPILVDGKKISPGIDGLGI